MKTLGLMGGMSWESTADYYRVINEEVKARLGGLHSAKICLWSVDFAEIEVLQHQGRWAETAEILAKAAQSLFRVKAIFQSNQKLLFLKLELNIVQKTHANQIR